MDYRQICLESLPEYISKEQFRIFCHISKSTARYLLQSGIVPCYNTGKKTRCYKINREDVIAYLENRELSPRFYSPPAGWNRGSKRITAKKAVHQNLDLPTHVLDEMGKFFRKELKTVPDVLLTEQIVKLTGYSKSVVNSWCHKGRIKTFMRNRVYHIPKAYLIEFFASDYCYGIKKKTDWHVRMLNRFFCERSACSTGRGDQ